MQVVGDDRISAAEESTKNEVVRAAMHQQLPQPGTCYHCASSTAKITTISRTVDDVPSLVMFIMILAVQRLVSAPASAICGDLRRLRRFWVSARQHVVHAGHV